MCAEPASPSERPNDENLFSLIAERARRATDGQLVIASAVGVGGAVLVLLLRPAWWFAALPLLCAGCFGVWGVADRSATDRAARATGTHPAHPGHSPGIGSGDAGAVALAGVRIAAVVIGTTAAALAVLVVMARVIGRWIS